MKEPLVRAIIILLLQIMGIVVQVILWREYIEILEVYCYMICVSDLICFFFRFGITRRMGGPL